MPEEPIAAGELAAVATLWRQQKRELVARFAGVSMLPAIPAGTPLAIACHGAPRSGDVILAMHRGQPLVHRVVAQSRDGRWLLTRGDANLVTDVPLAAGAVIGRVLGIADGEAIAPVAAPRERVVQRIARWIAAAAFRIGPRVARVVVNVLWRLLWTAVWLRRGRAANPS